MNAEQTGHYDIQKAIDMAETYLEKGRGLTIIQIEESDSLKNAIAYVMSTKWRSPIYQSNFIDLFLKLRRKTATDILGICHESLSSKIPLADGEKNAWCDQVIKHARKNNPKRSDEYINELTVSIMDILSQEIQELNFDEEDFFDDFSSDNRDSSDIRSLPSTKDIVKEKIITLNPSAIANDFLTGKSVDFAAFKKKMIENEKFALAFINALNNKQLVNEINGNRETRIPYLNALYWLTDKYFEKSWGIFIQRAESFLQEKVKRDRFKIIWLKIVKESKSFTTNQKNTAISLLKENVDFSQFKKPSDKEPRTESNKDSAYSKDMENYFKTGMYTENILENCGDERERIKMGEALANKYVRTIKLADSKERPMNYRPDKEMDLFCDFLVLIEYEALSYTVKRFLEIYYDLNEVSLPVSTRRKVLFFLVGRLRTQFKDEPEKLKMYQNKIIEIISGVSPTDNR